MRIGIFTDTYMPFINGVSTSVSVLKKALEKKGHQVFLVTVNPENMKYKYEDGGKVIRLPGVPVGIYNYRLTEIYPVRVINRIKKWKLDVIHSHTEFGVGTFARIISKQFGIPLVHTYHTMYEDYVHYITHGYFKKSSKKLIEYLTLFYCDTTANELIVPTKKTWDLFKEKYKLDKNIHIIPTGLELDRFYKEKFNNNVISKLKEKVGIDKDDFVLLFVGRLGTEKSVDFLIEAQKDILETIPNSKLLIIGDGPEKDDFISLSKRLKISNNIIFTGMIPYDEIPMYYQMANLFVTASKTETQGLTLIEAMAAGVVPLCIDDESFKMVVVDELNGKIFKNKRDYKKAVNMLYNDRTILNRMSKQARINAEMHSSKYYAESVLDVYRQAITDKKKKKNLLLKLFSD